MTKGQNPFPWQDEVRPSLIFKPQKQHDVVRVRTTSAEDPSPRGRAPTDGHSRR